MDVVKWWWKWILVYLLKSCVQCQVAFRNNVGHSYYNNYNPNHYTNLQSAPGYYQNNYYALQRRPYAATGAHRSHNMVDYHSRVGYVNSPVQPSYDPQQSKAHSIIYANRMDHYGASRIQISGSYWGEWSTWSKCSKPCNGGVKTRIRVCQSSHTDIDKNYSPTGAVINNCKGYRRGYKACNTQVCMTKAQMKQKKHKEREQLCAQHNRVQYHGETYKWIPYLRVGLSECKLNCLADGHKIFKSFGNVRDEMICGHEDGYTCQNGHCKKAKVNSRPSSKPTGGNSPGLPSKTTTSSEQRESGVSRRWVYVKKDFLKTTGMTIGYNHVLRLPRGAVNITIKERAPSHNFFALKIGKLFILNGRWQTKSNKLFYAASSIFRYIITRMDSKTLEMIFSPGPLAEEVDVMVLYRRSMVNITYEYALPNTGPLVNHLPYQHQHPSSPQSIIHGVSHFPPQTNQYQQASLNSAPTYRYNSQQNNIPYNSAQNNVPYNSVQNSVPYNSPQNNAPYNSPQGNVPYNPGVMQGKPYRVVGPRLPLGRAKPVIQQVTYKWQIGGIKKCSANCNGGDQEYTYRCFASKGKSGKFVDDASCQHVDRPPPRKRICNLEACPAKWETTSWSKCSKECGRNSVQHRTTVCKEFQHGSKSSFNVKVNSSKCSHINEPVLVRECSYIPCTYNWKVGPWGKCSKTCDQGIQRRYVLCQNSKRHYFPQEKCEDASKPNNTRSCLEAHCSSEWYVSEWDVCTSACGDGMQKRTVVCRGSSGVILSEGFCESDTKPSLVRKCTGSVCNGAFWVTSPWSKCSSRCGTGNQYRKTFCASTNNHDSTLVEVNEKMCSASSKPSEVHQCVNKDCNPLWYTTNWQECSATCGRGIQRRQRICMAEDGKLGRGCYYQLRPTLIQFCSKISCTRTVLGFPGSAKRTTHTRFSSLLHRRYNFKRRPSARIQRTKSILIKKSTDPLTIEATTTAMTTTTTIPLTPSTTTPPQTTTTLTPGNYAAVISTATTASIKPPRTSKASITTRNRIMENQLDKTIKKVPSTKKKISFIIKGRADLIRPALTRNAMSRQSIIYTKKKINLNKLAVQATVRSITKVVPKTARISQNIIKATNRETERDKNTPSKKAVRSSSADKSVNKTCVDFYSSRYCTVIATRLKFCGLTKFRKDCCHTCTKK